MMTSTSQVSSQFVFSSDADTAAARSQVITVWMTRQIEMFLCLAGNKTVNFFTGFSTLFIVIHKICQQKFCKPNNLSDNITVLIMVLRLGSRKIQNYRRDTMH